MKIYNAMEVANLIIDICTRKNHPISNLHLQKLLYFVWVDYYRETHKSLFIDCMFAWQFGPVVPEVYYEYCSYGGRPINICCENEIKPEDIQIIGDILEKYQDVSVSELVEKTHRPGTAWYEVFDGGKGNKRAIPFKLIIEKELGEKNVS